MRNDQIFVLLLVILLPMSGCFGGGGLGTAEADGDGTENKTMEMFTSFVSINNPANQRTSGSQYTSATIWEYAFSINTTSTEGLEIISVSNVINGYYFENYDNSNRTRTTTGNVWIISNCDSGQTWNTSALSSISTNLDRYIPTVGDTCQHEVYVSESHLGEDTDTTITDLQISVTWKLHEVIVV
jgi:hypothetical protein